MAKVTGPILGVFDSEQARLIGITQNGGTTDITYLAGQDAPTPAGALPVTGEVDSIPGGKEVSLAGKELFPTLNVLTAARLKKARLALAKQQSGDAPFRVAFLTDSTGTGQSASGSTYAGNFVLSPCAAIAKQLAARGFTINTASRFGDNNVGRANLAAYDPRMGTIPAAWVASSQALTGADYLNNSTVDKLLFTPADSFQFDRIEVIYRTGSNFDTFHIAVDGGASLLAVNAVAATGVAVATATCALGAHTVNIYKGTANSNVCSILSIRCYNSAAPAIELWNMAVAGSKTSYFIDESAVYKAGPLIGTTVQADLWFIGLTINDTGANSGGTITNVATYKAQLQTLVNKCRLSGDVIFHTGNPITGTGSANQEAIIAAFFEVAKANSIPVVDIYGRWVDQPTAVADGFMIESIHPAKYGYKDIGNALMPFIVP